MIEEEIRVESVFFFKLIIVFFNNIYWLEKKLFWKSNFLVDKFSLEVSLTKYRFTESLCKDIINIFCVIISLFQR